MVWFTTVCYATETLYVSVYVDRTVKDQRIAITIFGKVTRLNETPVSLAAVSIEVNDPHGSSVHIAFLHSDNEGLYTDIFELEIPLSVGNYTIHVTASKPGFQDSHTRLVFSTGVAPYNISISPTSLTLTQGEMAVYNIRLESEGEISSIVNMEVIGLPESVMYTLDSSQTPPSSTELTIETSEMKPGNYTLTIVGRSREGERRIDAQLIIKEQNRIWIYALMLILITVVISAILLIKRKKSERKPKETISRSPKYLEGLALSPSTLLSLPDHLRKTAIILCELREASANEVAARSGRARAAESDYLNQLVRIGIIKKKRRGRESYFYVD